MIRAKAISSKNKLRFKRKLRIRGKIFGIDSRPRVSIFKSNKNLYSQVVDDNKGFTLCSADSRKLGTVSKETANKVAEELVIKLKDLKISDVVFDKNGYKYHGVIKSFVDTLRNSGIKV
jgi:large subunit ribosomal protein L18